MSTPTWFRRTIGMGDFGPDVNIVRRKLGLAPGQYTVEVAALVRGICQRFHLAPADEVTPEVAAVLGETEATSSGLPPEWFVREIGYGDSGPDVQAARSVLGLRDGILFDGMMDAAVRRFQAGTPDLEVTGVIGIATARLMGEAA